MQPPPPVSWTVSGLTVRYGWGDLFNPLKCSSRTGLHPTNLHHQVESVRHMSDPRIDLGYGYQLGYDGPQHWTETIEWPEMIPDSVLSRLQRIPNEAFDSVADLYWGNNGRINAITWVAFGTWLNRQLKARGYSRGKRLAILFVAQELRELVLFPYLYFESTRVAIEWRRQRKQDAQIGKHLDAYGDIEVETKMSFENFERLMRVTLDLTEEDISSEDLKVYWEDYRDFSTMTLRNIMDVIERDTDTDIDVEVKS